jgi:hypothetical protein
VEKSFGDRVASVARTGSFSLLANSSARTGVLCRFCGFDEPLAAEACQVEAVAMITFAARGRSYPRVDGFCSNAWYRGNQSVMDDIRVQDLSADEIRAALDNVDPDMQLAVAEFLQQIGGLVNARLAIAMLAHLEDAA